MMDILSLAQKAWDETAFFKSHYSGRPTTLSEVKSTSFVAYHQASGLEDCLINLDHLLGAVPSFYRNHRRLPISLVESEQEWDHRQLRFIRALEDLGAFTSRPKQRFLIVADDVTGPFACELSKFLSWNKCQAPISFNGNSPEIVQIEIKALAPDTVLVLPPAYLTARMTNYDNCIYFAHTSNLSSLPMDLPACLVCDPLHVIGAKPKGQGLWLYDAESLIIEREEASGFSLVTNERFDLFPVIRYQLEMKFEGFVPRNRSRHE